MKLTVQDCLDVQMELDDCTKAGRQLAPKLKQLQAEDLARLLLTLVDEYDAEEFVLAVLGQLETMPIAYFEAVLGFDNKLDELYNSL